MGRGPTWQWQRGLLALTVFCIFSMGGAHRRVESQAEPWLGAEPVHLASQPVASTNYSCPPDPCVPGNAVGRDFFVQVVEQLSDVPLNEFAVDALVAWEPWENTLACWNPLATTQPMSVICDFNTAGVQSYQNQDMGVQATGITLNLGYYNAIRSMLRLEAFDREALRAALDIWGTCAGISCDPLLNAWQDLWNAYVGTCCGCLPANCCSAADIAQPRNPATTTDWNDPGGLNGSTLLASTELSICQTASAPASAPIIGEAVDSCTAEEATFSDVELPSAADVPVFAPIEDHPESAKSTTPSTPDVSLTQSKAVQPERIPPASASYSIVKSVFGSGGGAKTSAHYVMNTTQGQSTDLSRRTSASYVLVPGYWGISSPRAFDYKAFLPVILRNH